MSREGAHPLLQPQSISIKQGDSSYLSFFFLTKLLADVSEILLPRLWLIFRSLFSFLKQRVKIRVSWKQLMLSLLCSKGNYASHFHQITGPPRAAAWWLGAARQSWDTDPRIRSQHFILLSDHMQIVIGNGLSAHRVRGGGIRSEGEAPAPRTVCFWLFDMKISHSKNRCYTEKNYILLWKKLYSSTTLSLALATESKIKSPRVQCLNVLHVPLRFIFKKSPDEGWSCRRDRKQRGFSLGPTVSPPAHFTFCLWGPPGALHLTEKPHLLQNKVSLLAVSIW